MYGLVRNTVKSALEHGHLSAKGSGQCVTFIKPVFSMPFQLLRTKAAL